MKKNPYFIMITAHIIWSECSTSGCGSGQGLAGNLELSSYFEWTAGVNNYH